MAIHLVACTSYGMVQLNAEELVENVVLQELLEKEMNKKSEYTFTFFALQHPLVEEKSTFCFTENPEGFSTYELEIHVPPPNFSQVIS